MIMSNGAIGGSWDDLEKEIFTPEEIRESKLRTAVIGELIKAKGERGLSLKKLEELSGVGRATISKMEKGYSSCKTDTLLKVLAALGKTLAVVPIEFELETEKI